MQKDGSERINNTRLDLILQSYPLHDIWQCYTILGVEREMNQVFVRSRDILLLSLGYRYYRHIAQHCQENEEEGFFPVHFYLESESDSLKSIQRICYFQSFFPARYPIPALPELEFERREQDIPFRHKYLVPVPLNP